MKAIIISDNDCKALLDKLKLESLQPEYFGNTISDDLPFHKAKEVLVKDIHRSFHYHVVRWLQDQGANLN